MKKKSLGFSLLSVIIWVFLISIIWIGMLEISWFVSQKSRETKNMVDSYFYSWYLSNIASKANLDIWIWDWDRLYISLDKALLTKTTNNESFFNNYNRSDTEYEIIANSLNLNWQNLVYLSIKTTVWEYTLEKNITKK